MRNKKIKLRFSAIDIGFGGAERILHDLLHHLSMDKYEITLFLFEKKGNYLSSLPPQIQLKYLLKPELFQPNSIIYKYLRKIVYRLMMYCPKLIYKLAKCEYCDIDIAFLQDTSYLLKANLAAKRIAWIHNNIEHSPTFKHGLRENLVCADAIICVSDGVTKSLLKNYPEFKFKTSTIYNPSVIKDIVSKSHEISIKYAKPTLVAVGRMKKQKGYEVLIDAFKIVVNQGHDWQLKILGDGELRAEIQNKITNLGLANNIELLGHVDNPYPYMKAANAFVLSSYWEGFGQVIVEAMALGVDIISMDCDYGPKEILENGKYGVLVPVGNSVELAKAIENQLLKANSDVNTKEALINRAHNFDINHTINRIEYLLDSLVTERAR